MSTQPEALRLANFLEMHWCNVDMPEAKAAAELRRLHAQRDALLVALRQARRCLAWACEQRPEFQAEYDAADAAIKAAEERQ